MTDLTTSSTGATQTAVAQQLSTASVKTANDVQKTEGNAAVELIRLVAELSPGPTGNNVDIQV